MAERAIQNILLFVLITLVPICDSLTGLLVRGETLSAGGLGTPSQLIRFSIIFLTILVIRSAEKYYILFLASLYLITVEVLSFCVHQSIQGLLIGLVFSYKFIYTFFIFFALQKITDFRQYTEKDILALIFKFAAYLIAIFLIGILVAVKMGISKSFFRTQGLFSSGNGLGILIGSLTMMIFYGIRKRLLSGWKPKILYVLGLLSLVLIATKASVIFLLINLVFLLFSLHALFIVLIIFGLISALVVFWSSFVNGFNVAFEIIIFRFEHKTSWVGFILSGRQDYLDNAFKAFNETGFKAARYIFGAGSFLSYESPDDFTLKYKMLEMDIFDTFFIYGIIGVLFYTYFIFYTTIRAFKKSRLLGWCCLTLFGHSVIAGHTMFNGLSATAIVFLLLLIKSRNSYKPGIQDNI